MATGSQKQLVRDLLAGRPVPRPAFLPIVYTYVANLEQVAVQGLLSDATLLANALARAQRLFGHDGIMLPFDPSLEAEACGCRVAWESPTPCVGTRRPVVASHPFQQGVPTSFRPNAAASQGRLPVTIEALRRTQVVAGRTLAIGAGVTGPLTLAARLVGEPVAAQPPDLAEEVLALAGEVGGQVARKYCEQGIDYLAVYEERLPESQVDSFLDLASTVVNIARYFNVHPVLLLGQAEAPALAGLQGAGFDALSVWRGVDPAVLPGLTGIPSLGVARDVQELASSGQAWDDLHTLFRDLGGRGLFLTTPGDLPSEVPAEQVRSIVARVHAW